MKKLIVVACVWLVALITLITCNGKSELQYTIQYDSTTKNTYLLKDEIQEVYTDLVSGVHEESYILMVVHNLEQFECRDNIRAIFTNNQLVIIEGNGKGDKISGELKTVSICLPQVQPRSFIQEMLSDE